MPRMALDAKGWPFRLAFFAGCPILLSLPVGLFQAGFAQYLSLEVSVVFWALAWLSTWWVSEFFLRVLHAVLRPWNVPLIAEIVLANILTVISYSFYFRPIMLYFSQYAIGMPPDFLDRPYDRGSLEHILALARSGLAGFIAWVLFRSLYAMLPARGSEAAGLARVTGVLSGRTDNPQPKLSRFRRELHERGVASLDRIVALQASDHYVTVHLDDQRTEFILARFSDAVAELDDEDGLRIHRSFWISRRAIQKVERNGSSMTAQLKNGLEAPVSVKYQGLFEHFLSHA